MVGRGTTSRHTGFISSVWRFPSVAQSHSICWLYHCQNQVLSSRLFHGLAHHHDLRCWRGSKCGRKEHSNRRLDEVNQRRREWLRVADNKTISAERRVRTHDQDNSLILYWFIEPDSRISCLKQWSLSHVNRYSPAADADLDKNFGVSAVFLWLSQL